MLRTAFSALRYARNIGTFGMQRCRLPLPASYVNNSRQLDSSSQFSTLTHSNCNVNPQICGPIVKSLLVAPLPLVGSQSRNVTKFSLNKGKRKTVKAVIKRFKRLDWGNWIRTKSGRNKKMWKKSHALKRRLRQHVLLNSTQSWLLDKMVTKYWRRPKYYINDPYEPYHKREEFPNTRKKPVNY